MGKRLCRERDLSCFSVGEKESEKLKLKPRWEKKDLGGDLGGMKRWLGPSGREQEAGVCAIARLSDA